MPTTHHGVRHRARFQLLGLVALTLAAACDSSDKLSPSSETPVATTPSTGDSAASVPSDSSSAPFDSKSMAPGSSAGLDSTGAPVPTSFATGTQPGIVFGSYGMTATDLNSIHTGILNGGGITETNVGSLLAAIKAKGGRLVLKMCMGDDKYVQRPARILSH